MQKTNNRAMLILNSTQKDTSEFGGVFFIIIGIAKPT